MNLTRIGRERGDPGNTFSSPDLDPLVLSKAPFDDFVKAQLKQMEEQKKDRFGFHNNLRKGYTRWANGARHLLALLGAIAFLLTGVAAAIRFASQTETFKDLDGFDMPVMFAV